MAEVLAKYWQWPKYRECRIRTYDPLVPNQVLYQAELIPVRACRQFNVLLRTKYGPDGIRTRVLLRDRQAC